MCLELVVQGLEVGSTMSSGTQPPAVLPWFSECIVSILSYIMMAARAFGITVEFLTEEWSKEEEDVSFSF